MYPNPTKDILNFDFNNNNIPSKINIFDINGKMILELNQFSNNSVRLSTKILSKGFYLVKVTSSKNEHIYKKLVIQ
jgi:hypothetical protein